MVDRNGKVCFVTQKSGFVMQRISKASVRWAITNNKTYQARQDFSLLKWGPSDFSSEK